MAAGNSSYNFRVFLKRSIELYLGNKFSIEPHENPSLRISESQEIVRGLKFRIKEVEGLQ